MASINKAGKLLIFLLPVIAAMEKILFLECLKKTLVNNVESASVPSLSLNGKETKEFLNVHVSVNSAARKKIFAKFALLIFSLDYQWISEINVVVKMGLT